MDTECRQTRKDINLFMEDGLEGKRLQNFLNHIESCPECREELSILFLVTEGIHQLETSNSYDIQARLEEKLKNAARRVSSRRRMIIFMYLCESIVILSVIIMVVFILMK